MNVKFQWQDNRKIDPSDRSGIATYTLPGGREIEVPLPKFSIANTLYYAMYNAFRHVHKAARAGLLAEISKDRAVKDTNTTPNGADALQEGSTVYALNARGANRWWASVQPGQDDEGKRISDDECQQIAHAIRAALSTAQPDRRENYLRAALTEIVERLEGHPAYADLTEAEEEDIGGDTAEFSCLVRFGKEALSAASAAGPADEREAFERHYRADFNDPGAADERSHFVAGFRAALSAADLGEEGQWPSNIEHVMRRIRRCDNETAALAVLKHAIAEQVAAVQAEQAGPPEEKEMIERNLLPHEQEKLESVARDEALLSQEEHGYLPKTPEEAAAFHPHQWVLEAMGRAYSMGRTAGAHRARADIRNVLGVK